MKKYIGYSIVISSVIAFYLYLAAFQFLICDSKYVIFDNVSAENFAINYFSLPNNFYYKKSDRINGPSDFFMKSKEDNHFEINHYWSFNHLSFIWEINAEIFRWGPDYAAVYIVFNRCGVVYKSGAL